MQQDASVTDLEPRKSSDEREASPAGAACRTTVASVMSRPAITVGRDMSIVAFRELLIERGISGAPVVDDEGRTVGLVSKTDLIEKTSDEPVVEAPRPRTPRGMAAELGPGFHEEPAVATVADIMTPVALTLAEGASVADASLLMAREGVHRVVITDAGDRVIGVLSSMDVLRWVAGLVGGPR